MDQLAAQTSRQSRANLAVVFLICGDILAVSGAFIISLLLRFDGVPFSHIYHEYLSNRFVSLPVSLVLYVIIFAKFRLYRYAWRFASLETVWGVLSASTVGLTCFAAMQRIVDGSILPRSVLIIFWMMSILLVGGVRIILRLASLSHRFGRHAVRVIKRDFQLKRVVILGGGSQGAIVLNALREDKQTDYNVLGFLDDNPNKQGVYIRDVRVIGPLKSLYKLLANKEVDEVFIALPDAAGDEIREYAMACRKQKVLVKIIPQLKDVINGNNVAKFEEISVEDLLRRPAVKIDMLEIGEFLTGKRILVTGAGGSIGSELCRQILQMNPSKLVLLGHGENSIHRIYNELRVKFPKQANRLRMVIASVADEIRVNQVFNEHKPQVVFHAAAHKHVPIMELNVIEAVHNNVIGTGCIAEACGEYGVQTMVLISTDKAVYPSSVMGATKRLCEKVVCGIAPMYRDTNYVAVRFGNVLGSRGSVVPIFHEQIKRGGPVTVTHPEMTRYFMLIPEAAKLVLEAGAIGRSGEVYLLDMGKPVKILDLAMDMIRLCGCEPDVDIKIEFSGMRPGEKLHEKLATDDETMEQAFNESMSIVRSSKQLNTSEVMDMLRQCRQLISRGDASDMYDYLTQQIPELAEQNLVGKPG